MKAIMKTKYTFGFLFGLAVAASSCSKDFLERPPLNQVTEETFWRSQNDVNAAVNGVYAMLGGQGTIYDDGSTDNAHAQYPWESFATELSSGNITTVVEGDWNFEDVRRCNYFLENADRAAEAVDAALLDRFKAEVRFLRAYFYVNKMNKYGDVPLLTETLALEETDVPRTARAEVLQFIIDELTAVSGILPESYGGGNFNESGRITRGAALAMLSRVYLYEGRWQEAAESAQQVMNMGYSLFRVQSESTEDQGDDYARWVDFTDPSDEQRFRLGLRSYESLFYQRNEGNSEVILDRQHIAQIDAQSMNTYLPSATLGGWSSVTPTQSMVDAYPSYRNGEAVTPVAREQRAAWYTAKDPQFSNEYRNRDPRFYASIQFDGSPWSAIESDYTFLWTPGASNMSQTGYNFRKLVDPQFYQEQIDNHSNIILIRLAEVLLTYAEARNELSGPDPSIFAALNEIRNRAGMPSIDQIRYASQSALREAIRRERRVELALEGHRYMDIRRWEIAPEVMQNVYDVRNTLAQARTWDNRLWLLPVPQREIDLSQGVLTQNPGY